MSYELISETCSSAAKKSSRGLSLNIVTARGLIKHFGDIKAADDVTFDIAEGECFGFLGPNGAGKTTVMRIIACFMPPTAGTVAVFCMDVAGNPSRIKSRIGIMPQDNNLDPDLSVFENLIVYARYFDIRKKDDVRLARALLEFVERQRQER